MIFDDKNIMVENISKQYSLFGINIINYLFEDLGCIDKNYEIYIKEDNKPMVLKYKNYYYIINSVKIDNLSLVDMIEAGMINIC